MGDEGNGLAVNHIPLRVSHGDDRRKAVSEEKHLRIPDSNRVVDLEGFGTRGAVLGDDNLGGEIDRHPHVFHRVDDVFGCERCQRHRVGVELRLVEPATGVERVVGRQLVRECLPLNKRTLTVPTEPAGECDRHENSDERDVEGEVPRLAQISELRLDGIPVSNDSITRGAQNRRRSGECLVGRPVESNDLVDGESSP